MLTDTLRDRLAQLLAMMYDRWEDGEQCYEDPEDYTGFLGHAIKLSAAEEDEIVELLKRFELAEAPAEPVAPQITKDAVLAYAEEVAVNLRVFEESVDAADGTSARRFKELERSCNFGAVALEQNAPPPQWVIVSDGEGAQACVITNGDLHKAVHEFMCCCGKPWRECEADMRWDIEQIDKPDNWANDEDGKPFSMTWPHETGSITLYRLSKAVVQGEQASPPVRLTSTS